MPTSSSRALELIAWMSLCMLAAAWGPLPDDRWRTVWSLIGAFGLAASVGLEAGQRFRLSREQFRRRKQAASRCRQRMTRLDRQKYAAETIHDATQRIMRDLAQHEAPGLKPDAPDLERRGEPRSKYLWPVEMSSVGKLRDPINGAGGRPFTVYLCDISHGGISLLHNRALEPARKLLTVKLSNGEQISFVVGLIWCQPQEEGWYRSGGRIIEVASDDHPASARGTETMASRGRH